MTCRWDTVRARTDHWQPPDPESPPVSRWRAIFPGNQPNQYSGQEAAPARDGSGRHAPGLTGMRNVPSPDMLRLMERSRFEVALRVLTAIAVLALLSYLLFGPSI
jgi:hypothetical protein